MLETAKYHEDSYARAVKAGCTIALGTDLGASDPDPSNGLNHGNDGKELYWAVNAGMTPLQAIEAGTANGPLTLGEKFRPLSGIVKEGFDADLIALESSPLEDIKILGKVECVTHVWKGGKIFKAPGLKCGMA